MLISIPGFLVSCDNVFEDNQQDIQLSVPSSAYSFQFSTTITDNETIVQIKPEFSENFNILSCEIADMKYYIDGQLVKEFATAPFDFEYKSSTLCDGDHRLTGRFTVQGKGYKSTNVDFEDEFRVGNRAPVSIHLQCPSFLRVGESLTVSPILIDRNNLGYEIKSITYKWNDKEIETVNSSPFSTTYKPTLTVDEDYSLDAHIKYGLKGSSKSYSYSYSTNVSTIDDERTIPLFSSIYLGYNGELRNGETIMGIAKIYQGTDRSKTYETNFYLDDNLIDSCQTYPYTFSYTLNNLAIGSHQLKVEWVSKTGSSTVKQSSIYNLKITK